MNIKANSPPPAYAALPPEPATSSQRQTPPPLPDGPNLQPPPHFGPTLMLMKELCGGL